jgi:hypothetical protein
VATDSWQVYRSERDLAALSTGNLSGRVLAGLRGAVQSAAAAVAPAPTPAPLLRRDGSDGDLSVISALRRGTLASLSSLQRKVGLRAAGTPNAPANVHAGVDGGDRAAGGRAAPPAKAAQMTYLRIDVTDTGAGISPQNIKKLFGQYVQFHAAELQKGGGSGLGLWIAKNIVDLHGGRIGATSEGEGKGTTFYVILPLYPSVAVAGRQSSKMREEAVAEREEGRAAESS